MKLSCCFDWCFRLFLCDRLVTRWIGVLGYYCRLDCFLNRFVSYVGFLGIVSMGLVALFNCLIIFL